MSFNSSRNHFCDACESDDESRPVGSCTCNQNMVPCKGCCYCEPGRDCLGCDHCLWLAEDFLPRCEPVLSSSDLPYATPEEC